jgi:citrate lyase subunit beta/citryl-CoA lyase
VLFAPANRPDMVAKLPRSQPDLVVLDLEDAVPASEKVGARSMAREGAESLLALSDGPAVALRVNAPSTEWFDGDVGILAGLETARGVADARDLLEDPRVICCYFGAEDYTADMGGVRRADNLEVIYPRSYVALAARLAGVSALDIIVTEFRDDERFLREAAEAVALGYAGKLCIHPSQVTLANRAFVPSAADVDRARRLLAAYDDAVAAGRAAIAFEGQMVDEPLAARARALLAAATDDD